MLKDRHGIMVGTIVMLAPLLHLQHEDFKNGQFYGWHLLNTNTVTNMVGTVDILSSDTCDKQTSSKK